MNQPWDCGQTTKELSPVQAGTKAPMLGADRCLWDTAENMPTYQQVLESYSLPVGLWSCCWDPQSGTERTHAPLAANLGVSQEQPEFIWNHGFYFNWIKSEWRSHWAVMHLQVWHLLAGCTSLTAHLLTSSLLVSPPVSQVRWSKG